MPTVTKLNIPSTSEQATSSNATAGRQYASEDTLQSTSVPEGYPTSVQAPSSDTSIMDVDADKFVTQTYRPTVADLQEYGREVEKQVKEEKEAAENEGEEASWFEKFLGSMYSSAMKASAESEAMQNLNKSLEEGDVLGVVGNFLQTVPGSMLGAAGEIVPLQYEAITGRSLENTPETGRTTEMDSAERFGSAAASLIDIGGMASGGLGRTGKGVTSLAANAIRSTTKSTSKTLNKIADMGAFGVAGRAAEQAGASRAKTYGIQFASDLGVGYGENAVQSLAYDLRNDTLDDTSLGRAFGQAGLMGMATSGLLSGVGLGANAVGTALTKLSTGRKASESQTQKAPDSIEATSAVLQGMTFPVIQEYDRRNSAATAKQQSAADATVLPSQSTLGLNFNSIGSETLRALYNGADAAGQAELARAFGTDTATLDSIFSTRDVDAQAQALNSLLRTNYNDHNGAKASLILTGVSTVPGSSIDTSLSTYIASVFAGSGVKFNDLVSSRSSVDLDGDHVRISADPFASSDNVVLPTDYLTDPRNSSLSPFDWTNLAAFGISMRAQQGKGARPQTREGAGRTMLRTLVEQTFSRGGKCLVSEEHISQLADALMYGSGPEQSRPTQQAPKGTLSIGEALAQIVSDVEGVVGHDEAAAAMSNFMLNLTNMANSSEAVMLDMVQSLVYYSDSQVEKAILEDPTGKKAPKTITGPALAESIEDTQDTVAAYVKGNFTLAPNKLALCQALAMLSSLTKALDEPGAELREDALTKYYGTNRTVIMDYIYQTIPDVDSLSRVMSRMLRLTDQCEDVQSTASGLLNMLIEREVTRAFDKKVTKENARGDLVELLGIFAETSNRLTKQYNDAIGDGVLRVDQTKRPINMTEDVARAVDENDHSELAKIADSFFAVFRYSHIEDLFDVSESHPFHGMTFEQIANRLSNDFLGNDFTMSEFNSPVIDEFMTLVVDAKADRAWDIEARIAGEDGLAATIAEISNELSRDPLANDYSALYTMLAALVQCLDPRGLKDAGLDVAENIYNNPDYHNELFGKNCSADMVARTMLEVQIRGIYHDFFEYRDSLVTDENTTYDDFTPAQIEVLTDLLRRAENGTRLTSYITSMFVNGSTEEGVKHSTALLDLLGNSAKYNTKLSDKFFEGRRANPTYADLNSWWAGNRKQTGEKGKGVQSCFYGKSEPLLYSVMCLGEEKISYSTLSENLRKAENMAKSGKQNTLKYCREQVNKFIDEINNQNGQFTQGDGETIMALLEEAYSSRMMQINNDILVDDVIDSMNISVRRAEKGQNTPLEGLQDMQVRYAMRGGAYDLMSDMGLDMSNAISLQEAMSNRVILMDVLFGGAEVYVYEGSWTGVLNAQMLVDEAYNDGQSHPISSNGRPTWSQFCRILQNSPTLYSWLADTTIAPTAQENTTGKQVTTTDPLTQALAEINAHRGLDGFENSQQSIDYSRLKTKLVNCPDFHSLICLMVDPEIALHGSRDELEREVKKCSDELIGMFYDAKNLFKTLDVEDRIRYTEEIRDQIQTRFISQAAQDISAVTASMLDLLRNADGSSTDAAAYITSAVDSLCDALGRQIVKDKTQEIRGKLSSWLKPENQRNLVSDDEAAEILKELMLFQIKNTTDKSLSYDEVSYETLDAVSKASTILLSLQPRNSVLNSFRDMLYSCLDVQPVDKARLAQLDTMIEKAFETIVDENNDTYVWDSEIDDFALAPTQEKANRIIAKFEGLAGHSRQRFVEETGVNIEAFKNIINDMARKTRPGEELSRSDKSTLTTMRNKVHNVALRENLVTLNVHMGNAADSAINVDAAFDATQMGEFLCDILFDADDAIMKDDTIKAVSKRSDSRSTSSLHIPEFHFGSRANSTWARAARQSAVVGKVESSIGLNGDAMLHKDIPLFFIQSSDACDSTPAEIFTPQEAKVAFADNPGRFATTRVVVTDDLANADATQSVMLSDSVIDSAMQLAANDPNVRIFVFDPDECHGGPTCAKCHGSNNPFTRVLYALLGFSEEGYALQFKKLSGKLKRTVKQFNSKESVHGRPLKLRYQPAEIKRRVNAFITLAGKEIYAALEEDGAKELSEQDCRVVAEFLTPAFSVTSSAGTSIMMSKGDLLAFADGDSTAKADIIRKYFDHLGLDDADVDAKVAEFTSGEADVDLKMMTIDQIVSKVGYDITYDPYEIYDASVILEGRGAVDTKSLVKNINNSYRNWTRYGAVAPRGALSQGIRRAGVLQRRTSMQPPLSSDPTIAMKLFDATINRIGASEFSTTQKHDFYLEDEVPQEIKNFDPLEAQKKDMTRAGLNSFSISGAHVSDNFSFSSSDPYITSDMKDVARIENRKRYKPNRQTGDLFVIATDDSAEVSRLLSSGGEALRYGYFAVPQTLALSCPELTARPTNTTVNIGERVFNVYSVDMFTGNALAESNMFVYDVTTSSPYNIRAVLSDDLNAFSVGEASGYVLPGFSRRGSNFDPIGHQSIDVRNLGDKAISIMTVDMLQIEADAYDAMTSEEKDEYITAMMQTLDEKSSPKVSHSTLKRAWEDFIKDVRAGYLTTLDPINENESAGAILSDSIPAMDSMIVGVLRSAGEDGRMMPILLKTDSEHRTYNNRVTGLTYNNAKGVYDLTYTNKTDVAPGDTLRLKGPYGKDQPYVMDDAEAQDALHVLLNLGEGNQFQNVHVIPAQTAKDRDVGRTADNARTSLYNAARLITGSIAYTMQEDGTYMINDSLDDSILEVVMLKDGRQMTRLDMLLNPQIPADEVWEGILSADSSQRIRVFKEDDAHPYGRDANRAIRYMAYNTADRASLGIVLQPAIGYCAIPIEGGAVDRSTVIGSDRIRPRAMASSYLQFSGLSQFVAVSDMQALFYEISPEICNRKGEKLEDNRRPLLWITEADDGSVKTEVLSQYGQNGEALYVPGVFAYEFFDDDQPYNQGTAVRTAPDISHNLISLVVNGVNDNDAAIDLILDVFEQQGRSLEGCDIRTADRTRGWDVSREDLLSYRDDGSYIEAARPAMDGTMRHTGIANSTAWQNRVRAQSLTFSERGISFAQYDEHGESHILSDNDAQILELCKQLKDVLGYDDTMSLDLFLNLFKCWWGWTSRDSSRSSIVDIEHLEAFVDDVANRVSQHNPDVFFIQPGVNKHSQEINGAKPSSLRFSLPLLPREILRTVYTHSSVLQDIYGKSEFDETGQSGIGLAAIIAQTESEQQIVNMIPWDGNWSNRGAIIARKTALVQMCEYLDSTWRIESEQAQIANQFSIADIRQIMNPVEKYFSLMLTEEEADAYEIQRQQLEDLNKLRTAYMNNRQGRYRGQAAGKDSTHPVYNNQQAIKYRTMTSKVVDNILGFLKVMSMISLWLPLANITEGLVRTTVARIGAGLGPNSVYKSVVSPDTIKDAVHDLEAFGLWKDFNLANFNGQSELLLQQGWESPEQRDLFRKQLRQDQSRWERGTNAVFRLATGDSLFQHWKFQLALEYLAIYAEREGNVELTRKVDDPMNPGKQITAMEAALRSSASQFLFDIMKPSSTARELWLRAVNSAERSTLAQDNALSMCLDHMFDNTKGGPAAKLIASIMVSPFIRYTTNKVGFVMSFVFPTSSLHYLIVDHMSKTDFGKTIGIQRSQFHARLLDAIISDAVHMTVPMMAIGICLAGTQSNPVITPPEDPDKEWDWREWSFCGEQWGNVWWIEDIVGLLPCITVFTQSCMNGKPNLAILMHGISMYLGNNPVASFDDIINLFTSDDLLDDFNIGNLRMDDGTEPTAYDIMITGVATTAASWLTRAVTPQFVRELGQTYKYEKSYKKVYAEGVEGVNSEAGQIGDTVAVDYVESQWRRQSRDNPLLATILDILNPDATTSYGANGSAVSSLMGKMAMPNTYYYDQLAYYNRSKYSIWDYDLGEYKSDAEMQTTALQILATFEDYYGRMDELYDAGFVLDYETMAYVSEIIWDMSAEVKDSYWNWANSDDGSAYVVGDGDFQAGMRIRDEVYDQMQNVCDHLSDLYYNCLWSDEMKRGVQIYFRENTTYRQTSTGEWYASGAPRGYAASFNMPFYPITEGRNTLGQEGDYQTPSVYGGGELSAGGRALVAYEPDSLLDTPSLNEWAPEDYDDTTSDSSNTRNTYGQSYPTGGYSSSKWSSGYTPRYYGSSSSRRSGGGSSSMPNIYSRVNSLNAQSAKTMGNSRRYAPSYNRLYPKFETKGSREASKRSDF